MIISVFSTSLEEKRILLIAVPGLLALENIGQIEQKNGYILALFKIRTSINNR